MESRAILIIEQVKKLYKQYGIKSVTMDDVAKHLTVSKKTLYEYFQDKEDLVKQVLILEHQHTDELFQEIWKKNLNAIEEMFELYKVLNWMFKEYNSSMEYDIRKYYPGIFLWIKEARRKRMYHSAFDNMQKGKREGLYRRELNAQIIARLHVFRMENLFDNNLFTLEELTSVKVFHEIFIYHLQGVLSHEGRSFFDENFDKFKASLSL